MAALWSPSCGAKESNGGLAVAAWNLVDPDQTGGIKTINLSFQHVKADARVTITRVDDEHGNVLPKYQAMGSPLDSTEAQVEQLNRETALPRPEEARLADGRLELRLAAQALHLQFFRLHILVEEAVDLMRDGVPAPRAALLPAIRICNFRHRPRPVDLGRESL